MLVLRNCYKLKNTAISVSEDYSKFVRETRRKLWQASALNRSNGDKVTLVYDKLKINGECFTWNEIENKMVAVKRARTDGHKKASTSQA